MKKYSQKIKILKQNFDTYKNIDKALSKMIEDKIIESGKELGELTLDEIAYILGITRERVRQIESSAIKKIRLVCMKKKIKLYL